MFYDQMGYNTISQPKLLCNSQDQIKFDKNIPYKTRTRDQQMNKKLKIGRTKRRNVQKARQPHLMRACTSSQRGRGVVFPIASTRKTTRTYPTLLTSRYCFSSRRSPDSALSRGARTPGQSTDIEKWRSKWAHCDAWHPPSGYPHNGTTTRAMQKTPP